MMLNFMTKKKNRMQDCKMVCKNFNRKESVLIAQSLDISKKGSVILGALLSSLWLTNPLNAHEKNGAFVGISLEVGRADQKTNAYKNGELFQVPFGDVSANDDGKVPDGQTGGCQPASGTPGMPGYTKANCVVNWTSRTMLSTNKNIPGRNQPMYGLGVMTGYKHFIGKKRWFGLRYYGFFDYGHTNFSNSRAANAISPFYLSDQKADMYTYGFGTDMLFNIIDKPKATAGFFLGVNFAGNTWTNNRVGYFKDGYVYGVNTDADAYMTNADGTITCGDTTPASCNVGINPNSVYTTGKLNAKVNNTIFQFLVNVGIRTNIFEHHGIEFGIKIPTLPNHFFKGSTTIRAKKQGPLENGQPTTITGAETNFSLTQTLRRQYSMYLRYVYTF